MGVMSEMLVAYAQPLLDETDGSLEQMNFALKIANLCWGLALMPEEEQGKMIVETRKKLKMNKTDFADFLQAIILPMIRRHQEMYPDMAKSVSPQTTSPPPSPPPPREIKYPGTGRNEPCPCNSGKKYKRCCGKI